MGWDILKAACVLVAAFGLVFSIRSVMTKMELDHWEKAPKVQARILEYAEDFHAATGKYKNAPGAGAWTVKIKYEYTVNGKRFEGTRISWQDQGHLQTTQMTDLRAVIGMDMQNRKPGQVFPVRYKSDQPQDALIVTLVNPVTTWIEIGVGFGLFLAGGLMWLMIGASVPKNDD